MSTIPSTEELREWFATVEPDGTLLAEYLDEFRGYEDNDFYSYVSDCASLLRDQHPAFADLSITWSSDTDGIINAASVEYGVRDERLGYFYVSKFVEVKHLTVDREASGRAGVFGILDALRSNYDTLSRYVEERGL